MFKNKFKALIIHFAISIVVVSFFISLIIYFWFPLEYLGLTKFKELALLIISVDLIMGPVLTFVVFNPNKKSLRFDLAVIAVLQFSALGYGMYTLFQDHPVFITFNHDRFTMVSAKYAQPNKAKYSEYNVSKFTSANLAFAKLPDDEEKKGELLFDAVNGGADLDQRVDYYEPYKNNINNIIAQSLNPEVIFSENNKNKKTEYFLKLHKNKIKDYAFLPLNGSSKYGIIVLDRQSAQLITTIDIDPWELSKN